MLYALRQETILVKKRKNLSLYRERNW